MPQVFQVLRCYKCLIFQILQVKKSIKWQCKVCGEKQSVKRHYGVGTGKDCRLHVQKLNSIRGDIENTSLDSSVSSSNCSDNETENTTASQQVNNNKLDKSKWLSYIDEDMNDVKPAESMFLDGTEVILENPKRLKKIHKKMLTNPTKNITTPINTSKNNEELTNTNTKYAQPLETPQLCCSIESSQPHNIIMSKKPLQVNQNSKWANYVDERVHREDDELNDLTSELNNSSCSLDIHLEKQDNVVRHNYKDESDVRVLRVSDGNTSNGSSKWATYVEANQNEVENDTSRRAGSNCYVKPQYLFSLCCDSELDNVLDI